jgi:hypothetical protein
VEDAGSVSRLSAVDLSAALSICPSLPLSLSHSSF